MNRLLLLDTNFLCDGAAYKKFYSSLSDKRKQKTDALRFKKDKRLSAGAGILLDIALADYGFYERDMQYLYGEHGKPYFENGKPFNFNISHSGTLVILAVSDGEVGCDAERIRTCDTRVAKRFFRNREYEALLSLPEGRARDEYFARLWVLKESYIKYTGAGLTLPLDSFYINTDGEVFAETENKKETCRFYEYTRDEYRIALCVQNGEKPELEIINGGLL